MLGTVKFEEPYFVSSFISGLKDEIKHVVKMFKPTPLNEVFEFAWQCEQAQESQQKKLRF
jgi:hypothetical protein